jgi:predicted RNA-binding Zn ribbon-like protein
MNGDERSESSSPGDFAPPAVGLVRDFVNTVELQADEDLLTTPEQLRDWFVQRGLLPADTQVRPADVALTRTVREGLRSVLLHHAGHQADPAALDQLNRALAEVLVRPEFTDTGAYRLVPSGGAAATAMGHLLAAIQQASEDGTWGRLKVCARDSCRWAFYDASRNRVGRWCSMAGCGNHVKMQRAYAARKSRRQPG